MDGKMKPVDAEEPLRVDLPSTTIFFDLVQDYYDLWMNQEDQITVVEEDIFEEVERQIHLSPWVRNQAKWTKISGTS